MKSVDFKKKSQISMEYLSIAGFAFLMTIPLIIIFYTQINDFGASSGYDQMHKISEEVVNSADSVYYMGSPSQITLKFYFPSNVKSVNFIDNYMYVNLTINGQNKPLIPYKSVANLSGKLGNHAGLHIVVIQANPNNVSINEK